MTIGLLLAALLFVVATVLGEKHALWIPAVVLLAAAAANAFWEVI